MNRNHKIFPCLVCGRDTGCVNRLVCARCRQAAAQIRVRTSDRRDAQKFSAKANL
jgi:hypothetical protein